LSAPVNMSYSSSTTTQTNTTNINPGTTNQEIIGVQIVTTGSLSPLSATSFTFNTLGTNGTTAPATDIQNARLWYTGSSGTFATGTQFGAVVASPNGALTITGTQTLAPGTNYFWLTYDIPAGATENNWVDARCNSLIVAGLSRTPTVQSPAGGRQIRREYLISNPSTITTCAGIFYDSGGPTGDYGNSENFTKTFNAISPSDAIRFTFTAFNTEASWDYLYVYDGPDITAPQIAGSPFHGTTIPPVITSSGSNLTFRFTSDGGGVRAGWAANISCISNIMNYLSSTVSQPNTTNINPGTTNQDVICVQVVTEGSMNPLSATSFTFNTLGTNGTTAPATDIQNARLWYTGSSGTFATATQFGAVVVAPNGAFTITGAQTLVAGTNYFWLTYDLPAGATENNWVDAQCNSLVVAGLSRTPTVQSPAGGRQIRREYLISSPSTITTCTGIFYDSGGPTGDYGNNENFTKTFASNPGTALRFTFTAFETEASWDYLYVYDGPDITAPQITGSPFHGTTIPPVITSSGSNLTFRFTSDGSGIRPGWAANIECVAFVPPNCVTYGDPANGATNVCPGLVKLNWTAPTTGFLPQGYRLYFGTNNPPTNIINGVDVGNVTSYDVANLNPNTLYRWRVEPYNSSGGNTTCAVRSFTTSNVYISSTNSPVTTCLNTAALTATGSGNINWYTTSSGGTSIGTGSPYNATFSGNTTFYVSASTSAPTTTNVGQPTWNSADGHTGISNWGIRFTTLVPVTINSVNVYVQTGGSSVIVKLQNSSGTDISTQTFTGLPAGLNTLPLNLAVNTPGDYRLVSGNSTNLGRGGTGISFPYTVPGVISLTSSEWGGTTTATYYFFYNWSVTANGGCESARIPVNVIHTAQPITITPSGPTTFMVGGSVNLTASSSASPPYSYTWSPAAGLNTTTGATVTASPATTTTYTVVGTNGTCTYSEQVTVTVTYPCSGMGTGVYTAATLPYTFTGTTCGMVNDVTSANSIVCGSTSYYGGEDVIHQFTPSTSGTITITLTSSGTWTGIMLYEGCPMLGQGGSCVAYAQSSTGNKTICVTVQSGITYYLIIDSFPSPTCNPYTIAISAPDPSGTPNDLPCDATPISIGGIESGDNACAGGSGEPGNPSCWTSGSMNTVWYSFVAPASGQVKIKTELGTLTNTQIAVYQGACNNLTMVTSACNQNSPNGCGGTSNNSALHVTGLTPGVTYYVRVDGANDLIGTFQIWIIDGINNWPAVPQQDCPAATQICNQQTIVGDPGFTGSGSICDYSTPYGCFSFGTQNNTVWYTIPVVSNGTMAFEIIPNLASTDYDWALFNITGNPAACSQVQAGTLAMTRCNFSGTSGTTGLRTGFAGTSEGAGGPPFCAPLAVTAGQTYLLLIWNWSGNNTGFTLDMFTSPINYSTPTSVTWTGGANTDWFNVVNWGGCAIPSCSIDAIVVNGPTNQPVINAVGAECKSISIQAGASLTINPTRQLRVCEHFTNYGSLNISPTATLLFNNAAIVQNMQGSLTGANSVGHLTITKTGGSVTLLQDIDIAGNFTTSNVNSVFVTSGNSIRLAGNFNNSSANTTFSNVGTTGRLTFYGAAAQTFNPGGDLVLNHVTMNHTGPGVTLNGIMRLGTSGILTLTNGKIITGANRVRIDNTNPAAVTNGTTTSYIQGNIRRYMATNTGIYAFPVGVSNRYTLAQIVNNNMTGVSYIDAHFVTPFTNTGSLDPLKAVDGGTPYANVCMEGVWQITPNVQPSSGLYDIRLWFNDGGGANPFIGLADNQFGPVKRPNASTSAFDWTALDGILAPPSTLGRTVAGGYALRRNMTSFSQFAIARSDNPLPVEVLSLSARCLEDEVIISWNTMSETNNDFFSLYKSQNMNAFDFLASIQGAGNSNFLLSYEYIDKINIEGPVYYQLFNTDYDGTENFVAYTYVDCNSTSKTIEAILLDNALNVFFVNYSDEAIIIKIIDYNGKTLLESTVVVGQNIHREVINTAGIASGIYYFVAVSRDNVYSKGFSILK